MSFRTIRIDEIQVIGVIWMPAVTCAQVIKLTEHDLESIGELTRENVEMWLTSHTGDFQSITDFRADIGEWESPWASEESECTFSDCMYGSEE